MRQRIDPDAELADGVGLFEQFAVYAAGPQHQRGGQTSDAAADDNRLHPRTPLNTNPPMKAKVACALTRPQAASSLPASAQPESWA